MTIPCFVISLKGSPRRSVIAAALNKLGISFQFFDAIDGRALPPDVLAYIHESSLSPPEIGCALSHMAIYKRMVSLDIDRAVILEDDAIVGERLKEIIANADMIPERADIINFFSADGYVWKRPSFKFLNFRLHKASGGISHAVGYFIRSRAARILIEANPKITKHADWPRGHGRLNFFLAMPFVVHHDPEAPSYLQDDRLAKEARRDVDVKTTRATSASDRLMKKLRRLHRKLLPHRFIELRTD